MSIWADIYDRSTGDSERKEDIAAKKEAIKDFQKYINESSGFGTWKSMYYGNFDYSSKYSDEEYEDTENTYKTLKDYIYETYIK